MAWEMAPQGRRQAVQRAAGAGLGLLGLQELAPRPAWAVDREFFNGNAVFKEDYYYKFGKAPPIDIEAANDKLDKIRSTYELPFVRIQTRYDAYNKYGSRVPPAIEAFAGPLKKAIDAGNWEEVIAIAGDRGDVARGLRPAGMFATVALSPDMMSNEALLVRFYINETGFMLQDMVDAAKNQDKDAALASWNRGRTCINSFVYFINQVINDKVGPKYQKI